MNRIVFTTFTLMIILNFVRGRSTGSNSEKDCDPLPPELLKEILGSAYNPRYMRLEPPKPDTGPTVVGLNNGKRETDKFDQDLEFYVNDNLSQEIEEDVPAWELNPISRIKRHAGPSERRQDPWHCQTRMKLLDLGDDYYPRYLRTAECVNQSCWYGRYACKPKAFALRILKRRKGVCIPAQQLQKLGFVDRQDALTEMWVWEEKAVNFCCECVSHENRYY